MTVQSSLLSHRDDRLASASAARADAIASMLAGARRWFARWQAARLEAAVVRDRVRSEEDMMVMARRYMVSQPSFAKDLMAACQNDRGRRTS